MSGQTLRQFISQYLLIMSQHGIRYMVNDGQREFATEAIYGQKGRETYISPNKDLRLHPQKDPKPFTTSPARFTKPDSPKQHDLAPPKAAPFRRRNESIDKGERDRSDCQSSGKGAQDGRREVLRFSAIKKKLQEQMRERQRLQEVNACQSLKMQTLTEQINKLRGQKRDLERVVLELGKAGEESSAGLAKAQQNIQQLNRNLKEARINQKSLANLKNLQNQLEYLQERNKKLTHDNEELGKQNKNLKGQLDKAMRESTEESDNASRSGQGEAELRRLLGQMEKKKHQREKFLENNLRELEKKLYETQNQMKKVMIQLNCIDRKKILSIDEVKTRKDQEIKDLRQRFMKVAKDLRQTKDKIQKNEKNEKKRNVKENAFLRKVKSSKNIGMASESQQLTFQLSSQA